MEGLKADTVVGYEGSVFRFWERKSGWRNGTTGLLVSSADLVQREQVGKYVVSGLHSVSGADSNIQLVMGFFQGICAGIIKCAVQVPQTPLMFGHHSTAQRA